MALLAFALGTGIGFAAGRMALVFWHPDEEHVASRIDALGAAFLVVYVVIEIGK